MKVLATDSYRQQEFQASFSHSRPGHSRLTQIKKSDHDL